MWKVEHAVMPESDFLTYFAELRDIHRRVSELEMWPSAADYQQKIEVLEIEFRDLCRRIELARQGKVETIQ